MPSCFRLATDRFAIGYIAGAVALLARFRRWYQRRVAAGLENFGRWTLLAASRDELYG
jgi:hypothetical protein